jgi:hypothetical protein
MHGSVNVKDVWSFNLITKIMVKISNKEFDHKFNAA